MVRKKLASSKTLRRLGKESKELQREVRRKTMTYIAAALGLVVGLAWNEAIKAVIEYLFPLGQNTIAAKLIYAFLMSVILVFVTVYVLRESKEGQKVS
mgnify:FL=1